MHTSTHALREAEAAVLLRDLHPEGTHLPQAVDDVRWILGGLVDGHRIDLLAHERPQLVVEAGELGPVGAARRKGMDEVELEVAEKQVANEAAPFPFLLARLLRDLP